MMHQPKPQGTTPDLLLWNRDSPDDILVIKQKLADLQGQKLDYEESIRQNDSIGQGIASLVETRATPREVSKFRFHIEDTEKITNLLVSLSGRLARTETSLEYLEESAVTSTMANCESEKVCVLHTVRKPIFLSKKSTLGKPFKNNELEFLNPNLTKDFGF